MNLLAQDSKVMLKTLELCTAVVEQPEFAELQGKIETFLGDDAARLQYQSVHESGEALNQKQRAGVELSDVEISEFEQAREELLKNNVVTEFMDAQRELQGIQGTISKYIGMTLELGKVPTEEEIEAASGGCCGGGCGGGSCG